MRGGEAESVEALEEEAEPRRARQLPVGHHLEADVLLAGDDAGDLSLQQGLVLPGRQAPLLQGPAGVLERTWPEQAADDLGAKRWLAIR
jgi:hypothetical protein